MFAALSLLIVSSCGQDQNWARCADDTTTPDLIIEGCTAVLQSRHESTPNRSIAFARRGLAYWRKNDDDRAIQDFGLAIELNPNYAQALNGRGAVYRHKGNIDRAIKDYDQAIRLNPKMAEAFSNRGYAYSIKGEYERAILDYDQAIRLNPENAMALRSRGMAKFASGRFSESAKDLGSASQFARTDPYIVLSWYISAGKSGDAKSADLTAALAAIDASKWPGAVAALYLGQTTPEQVHTAATSNLDLKTVEIQKCEAAYFIAEYELLRKRSGTAKPLLQEVSATCPHDFVQWSAANAELKRIP